ncbi:MAG: DNA repair protein [Verrucomicrobia bacterium]|nr:DNA repair protein [Verrucomicrobiota bacterium]
MNLFLLMTMALTLGMRHGFDLDHLATIDAITRTVRDNKLFSRFVGFLFSLGHGIVVILISLIIGSGLMQSHIPQWLDGFGKWVSIVFLLLFGAINLYNVFQNQTLPTGFKSFLVKKFAAKRFSPFVVITIGAIFALSFDTFSQIALFSISASLLSGWVLSGILGFCFMIGMMLSDGLNGLVVSTLIQRADRFSIVLSRGLGLAISLFSLVLGVIALFEIL